MAYEYSPYVFLIMPYIGKNFYGDITKKLMQLCTGDLHLGHRAAIRMCERPLETVEEMNETLIRNFNSCVKKNDTVYILGDIAHRTPVVEINQLINRLNGKKILCKGNHDKKCDGILRYDVGVDANNFYPVSIEHVKEFFEIKL